MYIYIGKYYHKSGKELNDLTEKKIGRTKDLNSREKNLNSTKFTIGYTFVRAWKTGEDTSKAERALHAILDDVRMDGEWFEDTHNTLVSRVSNFMAIQGYPSETLPGDENEKRVIDMTTTQAQQVSYSQIKEKLTKLGIEFEEKTNTHKKECLLYFNINDIKMKIGVSSTGSNFYIHTRKNSGEEYFISDKRFSKTTDGWRIGQKGEAYTTGINDLFDKVRLFEEVSKK